MKAAWKQANHRRGHTDCRSLSVSEVASGARVYDLLAVGKRGAELKRSEPDV